MKKLVLLLLLILPAFFSCKEDVLSHEDLVLKLNHASFPQKWTLVSMRGNIANIPPAKGKDMDYQEFYILNADSTFSKTRNKNGVPQTVHGTYSIHSTESTSYLTLTHAAESPLVSNCLSNLNEDLVFQSENTLNSTWQACDGPSLIYTRSE